MRQSIQNSGGIFTISRLRFKYFFFLASIIGCTLISFGQNITKDISEKIIKHQIEFRHDNDFLVLTDRYYSSGIFLIYRKRLEKGLFSSQQEQLTFSIGQVALTPSDVKSKDFADLDRPYAGFLGLNSGWSFTKNNRGIDFNLLVGVAGKASGAGDFQRWYHNAIVIADPPVWFGEIENSVHMNLYMSYIYEWRLSPNPFSVHVAVKPQIAFGTKDIYIHPEVITYFGRRNALSESIAHNRIRASNREIFFSVSVGYRFIGQNGLLEGNALGDNSIYVVAPQKTVLYGGFDFLHRYGQNDYKLGYRINSAETAAAEAHKYIILSFARSF